MLRPRRTFLASAGTALLLAAASAGLSVLTAGGASAASVNTPLPAHVFAPYWEAYSGDDPLAEAQASGDKYLTAAFIQTASAGSCTAYWNGSTSQPIASSTWGSDFSTMQADGGGIIPSFGGYTADHDGTDIADSCTSISSIAAAYESVITTYNVSRIDLDIEDNSLTNTAGYTRRNQAVAQVESWAAANNRTIQFSYTMPTTTTGLTSNEISILQNAKTEGATVSVVNIMTFDYYIGTTQEMATDTESAAQGLHSQLQSLYPGDSSSQLWAMIGVTEMIGIDDYGSAETFTEADASTVLAWANQQGISTLSFWALERDNGGCVGTGGSDSCSGISQSTWYFSNKFAPFTSGSTTTTNGFSVAVSPTSGSVAAGSSATATVSTAVTSGSAQSLALTASGAPSGVTVSFSPSSVTAGSSSTVTFATTSSAASGSYPITITGTGSSGTETATYTLTVTGGSSGGGGSLTNGDFETGALSPWTCQSGDAVQSTTVHSGKYALEVVPTGSATGECDQAVTLKANTAYTLSGWVEGSYAFIGVSGGATTDTWSSSSSWNQLKLSFTTGSSGAVTVYVHGWYAQGNVYADDFTLTAN
ncbi:carbohydrate binding domain-containing protein [Actinospica sp. MGRD01-02]|uniref:chitinase n=1 Tax=Actinospica acidithermotolerans TaxID=2828514 RepID=A0A941ILB1_9ACTN|nr:carbohydrate binding domain-containing protein [Actinospica acidithermotolerans]MBR7829827.1 carbohydrate binding domain-containing protein [Actinospica acidithermotolerans]